METATAQKRQEPALLVVTEPDSDPRLHAVNVSRDPVEASRTAEVETKVNGQEGKRFGNFLELEERQRFSGSTRPDLMGSLELCLRKESQAISRSKPQQPEVKDR